MSEVKETKHVKKKQKLRNFTLVKPESPVYCKETILLLFFLLEPLKT